MGRLEEARLQLISPEVDTIGSTSSMLRPAISHDPEPVMYICNPPLLNSLVSLLTSQIHHNNTLTGNGHVTNFVAIFSDSPSRKLHSTCRYSTTAYRIILKSHTVSIFPYLKQHNRGTGVRAVRSCNFESWVRQGLSLLTD
jgi:hypothetical protein